MLSTRRSFVLGALGGLLTATQGEAGELAAALGQARGQVVYFNAWGGSEPINAYIAWVGQEVLLRFGIELVHVKLADTGEAVARVLAEKAAGRTSGGSVDLIWINGENFRAMKREGLLWGPFVEQLPHFALVDVEAKPTTVIDFTEPTEGYECPWGMAQFVFIHDSAALPAPPRSVPDLLDWAQENPGRLTWPAPPDFIGTTFLKHVLYELGPSPDRLRAPVTPAEFSRSTRAIWERLEGLRASLWRKGRSWPGSGPALHQLFEDGEVDISMAFNPAEASSLVGQGRFPATTRSFILEQGTIANTHFVAIPFNANARDAALVVTDFLLTPLAQARKQDPAGWGDFTVLDMAALSPPDRALFDSLPRGIATLSPEQLLPVRLEPDASWTHALEASWRERYAT